MKVINNAAKVTKGEGLPKPTVPITNKQTDKLRGP
jgi:hypothetical protein